MGCRDQGSNFNAYFYMDGQWWCGSGLELTFEAPDIQLIADYLEKTSFRLED